MEGSGAGSVLGDQRIRMLIRETQKHTDLMDSDANPDSGSATLPVLTASSREKCPSRGLLPNLGRFMVCTGTGGCLKCTVHTVGIAVQNS
jgi:hypothetical protein